ncbi:MAG TPA: TrmH family RNA methyltransferase, partial [Casimicrobiaceae bacterium]|nr:TrmH family RNA methyltransferase [Casimicrobiaceae bacterium]
MSIGCIPLFYGMPVARLDRVRIVLVETSLAANIGAAARAMLTMGLTRLVLVAPRHFPHADATALAAGATQVLADAHVVATLDDALAGSATAIALTARPRRYAGRVLALRDAAREAVQRAAEAD